MSTATPLKLAGRMAAGSGLACDVADSGPVTSDDISLYLRDVSWAKSDHQPSPSAAARTPTKLRKAIDEAAVRANTIHKSSLNASSKDAAARSDSPTAGSSSDPSVPLRAAVRDAVSQLEATLLDVTARVVRTQKGCGSQCKAILDRVMEFDANTKYVQRVGFDVARLIRESKIATDRDFQLRYGTSIVIPDKDRYLSVLEILHSRGLQPDEIPEMKKRITANVTKPLLPLDDASLATLLVDVNVFSTTDVLAAVRAKLAELSAKTDLLTAKLEELMQQAASAKSREDLALADTLEDDIIGVMREIFRVNLIRLELVHAGASDSGSSLMAKLEAIMNEAAISRAAEANKNAHMQALRDSAILDKDRAARHQQHQQALANYQAAMSRSKERIERNAYQQQLLWDEVVKTLGRIEDLRREADEMTTEHLRVTDVEQKRRKEYAEYQESFASRREYVRLLQDNTETASDFLERVNAFMAEARKKIEGMRIEEHLNKLSLELRNSLEAQYTQLSGRAMKRVHALESRVTNAQRQKEELAFLVKQAPVVTDVDKASYQNRVEILQRTLVQLSTKAEDANTAAKADQAAYLDAVCTFEDFSHEENVAVKSLKLRSTLRDQYTASLGSLLQTHATDAEDLRGKAGDHARKADAIAEVRKCRRESPARGRVRPPPTAQSVDEGNNSVEEKPEGSDERTPSAA